MSELLSSLSNDPRAVQHISISYPGLLDHITRLNIPSFALYFHYVEVLLLEEEDKDKAFACGASQSDKNGSYSAENSFVPGIRHTEFANGFMF